jgi:chromosome segregation ATPase
MSFGFSVWSRSNLLHYNNLKCFLFVDVTDQLCQLRDLQTKLQGDISTKRSVIDNLSSQMATLARYQAEKRSKNKETEEAITKLSENLARLNWKPLWKYGKIGLLSSRKKIKEIEEAITTSLYGMLLSGVKIRETLEIIIRLSENLAKLNQINWNTCLVILILITCLL